MLDLACGTGWASRSIARQYPGVKLFGIDIGPELIDVAKAKAAAVSVRSRSFATCRTERSPTLQRRTASALNSERRSHPAATP